MTTTARPLLLFLVSILASLQVMVATAQPVYGYRVLERKAQSRQNYVQGLQIVDGKLYVSTGRYGYSALLRYHFEDGGLERQYRLDRRLFGEGLTVVGEEIFQLTWKSSMVLVYERETLQPKRWFHLPRDNRGWFDIPGEGWGLTFNGEYLIYSDGSDRLYFMDPDDGRINHSVRVHAAGSPVHRLNELEWIDGKIWANVYQTDQIVIIAPDSGEVAARVDLKGLLPDSERLPGTDVLNGIAHNAADGSIWVTGKNWPWLYRIELVPPATLSQEQSRP